MLEAKTKRARNLYLSEISSKRTEAGGMKIPITTWKIRDYSKMGC